MTRHPNLPEFVCLAFAVALLAPNHAYAQNVTGISTPHEVQLDTQGLRSVKTPTEPRIAVPVGVGADLGSEDQKGVAPAIGFQLWKNDRYFIGAFFTIAATDPTVSEKYGAFVLNPPLKGHSFYVSGNYILNGSDTPPPVLYGIGGRWGTTSSSFEFTPTGGTATKQDGFGLVASVTAQIMTKTHRIALGEGDETSEFQLGLELGPTWRLIGGDLSQNDAFRQQLLGTDESSFVGFEMTFFVRVNAVQPFARFTSFSRPNGVAIPGLTGRQVVWGVNVASALFNAKTN